MLLEQHAAPPDLASAIAATKLLRQAVKASATASGSVQLTDSETGFAVELTREDATLLAAPAPAAKALWDALLGMGLTDAVSTAAEARHRQRKTFSASTPPVAERLRNRIASACREVPFFSRRANSYDCSSIAGANPLHGLPFMRKSDIRANFPDGLIPETVDVAAGLRDGSICVVATSGSTEERIQVFSYTAIERLPFGSDDLFALPIGGTQPRTAIFTTPVCFAGRCHSSQSSFEARLSSVCPDLMLVPARDPFVLDRDFILCFCDDIERFRPIILAADPIYLQCLVRRAREFGIALPKVQLIQRDFEFGTQAAIRDLRNGFNAPVFDDYGASEENRLAVACHQGSLHVRSDAVYLEILNEHGPCPPGVVGAVAVTSFLSLTPLIRYLIGDLAEWTGAPCRCEFADWPTLRLHGRARDRLRCGDHWMTPLQIDEAIGAPAWLDFYRVNQLDEDEFEIQVIPSLGMDCHFAELIERLQPSMHGCSLHCKTVSRLEPLPSLKFGNTLTRTIPRTAP